MDSGQKMGIDIADASSPEVTTGDEPHYLVVIGHCHTWQGGERGQDHVALAKCPERMFTPHERVHRDLEPLEVLRKARVALPQVVGPHGCVDEDHSPRIRRRGISLKPNAS